MSAIPAVAAVEPQPGDDLLRRIRAGDRRAPELLMRRYNRTLYRTARAILHQDAEAEDAVQETYLQAFRRLDTFRGDAALGTWLVRIAINEALMRRRQQSRRAVVLPIDPEDGAFLIEQVADVAAAQPENEAMNAELRRILEQCIDALPDLYRTVFMLRAVEEMSVEETARVLDLPEATVRTRFFRARALMRSALGHDAEHAVPQAFGFDGERCDRIVRNVMRRLARD